MSNEMLKYAYQLGLEHALAQAGLDKTALVKELGSRIAKGFSSAGARGAEAGAQASGWLSANPAVQRALIGAGIGGVVGGTTDIGAGRGMLAGGLAGAGSAWGQRAGQKMVRQGYKSELAAAAKGTKALPGQGLGKPFAPAGVTPVQGPIRSRAALEDVIQKYTGGAGARGLQQTVGRGGNLGALGLGTLAGGGALMATQPSQPKPWYSGLMGG